MATPNPNVDKLSHAYEIWRQTRGRSIETWVALASPDIVIRSGADQHAEGHFGAVPAGHDGLRRYLSDLLASWIMEDHEVQRYIAHGDDVAVVIAAIWRNRVTNKRVACPVVDVWTFRHGLATSVLEVFDTAALVQAATPDAA